VVFWSGTQQGTNNKNQQQEPTTRTNNKNQQQEPTTRTNNYERVCDCPQNAIRALEKSASSAQSASSQATLLTWMPEDAAQRTNPELSIKKTEPSERIATSGDGNQTPK
jgi:hypothetical protein